MIKIIFRRIKALFERTFRAGSGQDYREWKTCPVLSGCGKNTLQPENVIIECSIPVYNGRY